MGIDFRRPGLRVPKQLLGGIKAVPAFDDHRGERMAQVVEPKTWQPRVRPDGMPCLLDRAQMPALLPAREDVRISGKAGKRPDDRDHQPADDDGPATGLTVREPQDAAIVVDGVIAKGQNLRAPAAGQQQKPDRRGGIDIPAFVLILPRPVSDRSEAIDPEKALPPVVLEQDHARHRIVGQGTLRLRRS